jgi:hypothetical protein
MYKVFLNPSGFKLYVGLFDADSDLLIDVESGPYIDWDEAHICARLANYCKR